MPEIADESLVNEDPEVPNKDAAPRPSTSTGSVTPVINIPKPGNMIITVGKRKFECVPIEGASDAAEKEKLNEIFQIPRAEQKAKMGPAHMQGLPKLPRCISDEHYIKMLKEKEDKRKKRRKKRGRRNVKKKQRESI